MTRLTLDQGPFTTYKLSNARQSEFVSIAFEVSTGKASDSLKFCAHAITTIVTALNQLTEVALLSKTARRLRDHEI